MNREAVPYHIQFSQNKGNFLTAKVYSDVRGDNCKCGGSFTGKRADRYGKKENDICLIPVCDKCANEPDKFRIVATFIDETGEKLRATVRCDQDGKRFENSFDVTFWFKTISREIETGEFDVNKYKSEESRKEFIFKNFARSYIAYHQKKLNKGEITPSGLRNKKNYTKHLMDYFSDFEIGKIRTKQIESFKVNFNQSNSQLRHCLEELKAILNHARMLEKINFVPVIKVKRADTREAVMTLEEGRLIVDQINHPVYRSICEMLIEYPVRPGEVRALRWKNIDLANNTIVFNEHFSDEKIIAGRKSRKEGEKYASLSLPLTAKAREILLLQVRSLNPDAHVFKGKISPYVSSTAFNKAWREAREKAGFIPSKKIKYDLYELKHAVLSELYSKTGGNVKILEKSSGVDIQTLMKHYVYSHDDLKTYFH